jgi:hypothetical protein
MRWKWEEKPKVGTSPAGVLRQVPRQAHDGRRHRHGSGSDFLRQVSVTQKNFPCVRPSRVTSAKPQATAAVASPWCAAHDPFPDMTFPANAARTWRSKTPATMYLQDIILEQPAQDLKDMAAALGPFIQEEHAMVHQRHLTRHRHVAPAKQPYIRDGVMRGVTQCRRLSRLICS